MDGKTVPTEPAVPAESGETLSGDMIDEASECSSESVSVDIGHRVPRRPIDVTIIGRPTPAKNCIAAAIKSPPADSWDGGANDINKELADYIRRRFRVRRVGTYVASLRDIFFGEGE